MRGSGAALLLSLYREGVFPMSGSRTDDEIEIIDPPLRGVLPLEGVHIPRRLARTVRAGRYDVRIDTAFQETVAACAASAPGREDTWISGRIEALYNDLFLAGAAHSVEAWREDRLSGGLYGVAIGGAFFGESMFSRADDASKVALVHLIARLTVGGFTLLDTQFLTRHLEQFGAVEISRREYRQRLAAAVDLAADFYRLSPSVAGADLLQAINQRS